MEEKSIVLTYYVNPQLFWYHNSDVPDDNYAEVVRVEEILRTEFSTNQNKLNWQPKVNDKVVLHYVPWNKFMRGEILEKVEYSGFVKYIVWATDHGFPVESKLERVSPLPTKFLYKIDRIRCGGLINIVPAEKEFVLNNLEVVPKNKWPQNSRGYFGKLIEEAASVTFIEMYRAENGQFWGDLKLTQHSGTIFMGSNFLIDMKYARKCEGNFKAMCTSMEANQVSTWLGLDLKENTVKIGVSLNRKEVTGTVDCNADAIKKVQQWVTNMERPGVASTADTEITSHVAKLTIHDVGFDDSASNSNIAIKNKNIKHRVGRVGRHFEGLIPAPPSVNAFSFPIATKPVPKPETGSNSSSVIEKTFIEVTDKPTHPNAKKSDETNSASTHKNSPTEPLPRTRNSFFSKRFVEYKRSLENESISGNNKVNDLQSTEELTSSPSQCGSASKTKKSMKQRYMERVLQKEVTPDTSLNNPVADSITSEIRNFRSPELETAKGSKNEEILAASDAEHEADALKDYEIKHIDPQPNVMSNQAVSDVNDVQRTENNLLQPTLEESKSEMELTSSPSQCGSASKTKKSIMKQRYIERVLKKEVTTDTSLNNIVADSITSEIRNSRSPELETAKGSKNEEILAASGAEHKADAPKDSEIKHIDPQPNVMSNQAVSDKTMDINHPNRLKRKINTMTSPPVATPKMLPAGYDLQNLMQYKNQNHWHLKSTTRNDRFPHDINNRPIATPGSAVPRTAQLQRGNDSLPLETPLNSNDFPIQLSTPSEPEKKFSQIINEPNFESEVVENKIVEGFKNNYIVKGKQISNESQRIEVNEKVKPSIQKRSKLERVANTEHFNEAFGENEFNFKRHANVLIHSKMTVNSIDSLKDTHFPSHVIKGMQSLKITKLYRIQAYAWSHIPRNNSIFIINPSESGKTWSCIAGICSNVLYQLENSSSFSYGPIAVILAATSQHVEKVTYYCNRLIGHITKPVPVVPSFGMRNEKTVEIELLNSCGILVTTPSNLLRLLTKGEKIRLFDSNRLSHFVIDDMDLMLTRSKEDFTNVLSKVLKMFRIPRSSKVRLQLVVTSREWDPLMVSLMKATDGILIIGDFLEATVYSQSSMSVHFCSSNKKIKEILKFIEGHPVQRERTIIFCNSDEEVHVVKESLTRQGFGCICYNKYSTAVQRDIIDEWTKHVLPTPEILVCTDLDFPELEIKNVNNVIHYSLSHNWTKFTKRFSAMTSLFENLVSRDFNRSMAKTSSLILLDESNNIQLPRLIKFMQKHGQTKHIDPRILAVAQQVIKQTELERNILCPMSLEYGMCDVQNCEHRHVVSKADTVTKDEQIPGAGDLRASILKVHSPVHFSALLQAYRSPGSKKWQEVRYVKEGHLFALQISVHYQNPANCIPHWPLNKNDLCVYKASDSVYHRARILKISNLRENKINATIKLIDEGTVISRVMPCNLFTCDNKFKTIPAQAIEIRLLGVVPFDNEVAWDSKATETVAQWLIHSLTETQSVFLKIKYAISNNIWASNVSVMDYMEAVQRYTIHLDLKKSLIEKNFGIARPTQCESIHAFIEPAVNSSESATEMNTLDVVPVLENLDVANSKLPESEHRSKQDGKKIAANTIDVEPAQRMKRKPELITEHLQKPLLVPKESWCHLPLNDFTMVEIGNEDENGNWKEMYLQSTDTNSVDQFEKLTEIIARHVENLKLLSYTFDESLLTPLQNCIIKYDNLYVRAKLHSFFGAEDNNALYRFFLCDCALFIDIHTNDCKELYPSSKEIIEFTPFQAVHCTLAGLRNCSVQLYKVTRPFLFAYTVAENPTIPSKLAQLKIRSFDILLYDCSDPTNPGAGSLLNETLIEKKLAEVDPEKEHLLVKAKNNANGFAALINCVKANFEFGDEEELEGFTKDLICVPNAVEHGNATSTSTAQNTKPNRAKDKKERTETRAMPKKKKEPIMPNDDHAEKVQNQCEGMPLLICESKHPQVKWYETNSIICLKINAPDIAVDGYELVVRKRSISFYCLINSEEQRFHLNFLGMLKPEYSSHEIRGLYIVVRLLKSVPVMWPQLLDNNEKLPWLSYDFDAIHSEELEYLLPQQNIQWTKPTNNDSNSDSDADSEAEKFRDFAPIRNHDDDFDPMIELC